MEIQMGKGEWLFCTVHERDANRHGLHIRKAEIPHKVGDIGPPYEPIVGKIPEEDVVVWFADLESLLIIQEQLVKCGAAMCGWKKPLEATQHPNTSGGVE